METKKISRKVFDELKAKRVVKGKYAEIVAEVIKTGEPVELSGLTRGQVAAVSRICKNKGLDFVGDYKNLKAYIAKKAEK